MLGVQNNIILTSARVLWAQALQSVQWSSCRNLWQVNERQNKRELNFEVADIVTQCILRHPHQHTIVWAIPEITWRAVSWGWQCGKFIWIRNRYWALDSHVLWFRHIAKSTTSKKFLNCSHWRTWSTMRRRSSAEIGTYLSSSRLTREDVLSHLSSIQYALAARSCIEL